MLNLALLFGLINRFHCSTIRQPAGDSPLIDEANQISEGVIRSVTEEVRNAPWKLKVFVQFEGGSRYYLYGYVAPINDVATLRFKPDGYGSVVVTRFAESNQFKFKTTGLHIGNHEGDLSTHLRAPLMQRRVKVFPGGHSGITFYIILEA